MNVAAFNVVAMNIPHIIECSSPDSATFDILFCLFRTWSLTVTFMCVGQAIVQGDEGPVSGVAQGVEDHGVAGVRHEEEKEEGEVEQEVESEKRTTLKDGDTHVHGWDESEKTNEIGLEPR